MTECVQSPGEKATHRLLVKYDPNAIAKLPKAVQPQFEQFKDRFGVFGDYCE